MPTMFRYIINKPMKIKELQSMKELMNYCTGKRTYAKSRQKNKITLANWEVVLINFSIYEG